METRHIIVEKYSTLNKTLKIDFNELFLGLGNVLPLFKEEASVWEKGVAAFKAYKSFSNAFPAKNPMGYRAYTLLFTAMRRAMMDLLLEIRESILESLDFEKADLARLAEGMQFAFEKKKYRIAANFFHEPEQDSFVADMQPVMSLWLASLGFTNATADAIAKRLPLHFVRNLNDTWKEKPEDFLPLQTEFQNIFPEDRLLHRKQYHRKLRTEWEKPIFAEAFGLNELYIPLRVGYKERMNPDRIRVVDGEKHIIDWLERKDPDYHITILRGGPGSGKSSLMKRLAFVLSQNIACPIHFIELQHFSFETGLEPAIEQYIKDRGGFVESLFDHRHTGSNASPILIFDGLDELSHTGISGRETANQFVNDLKKLLDRKNSGHWSIRAIITGRDIVIQPHERDFGTEGQALEILPLCLGNLTEPLQPNNLVGEEWLIKLDQRQIWWKTFLTLKGHKQHTLPEFLDSGEFFGLSAQPLLNYLIALSFLRGNVDLFAKSSINEMYEDLVNRVVERPWGQFKHISWDENKGKEKQEFHEFMEEVAVSAWHFGDVRITTLGKLKERCERNRLIASRIKELSTISPQESAYLRLLTAFYIKPGTSNAAERVFEFTHKSFGEYLVACRILRCARRIKDGLENNSEYFQREHALREWVELCGPVEMTQYIWDFLEREISRRIKMDEAETFQMLFAGLFSEMISKGFGFGVRNYLQTIRIARNVEGSMLLLISAFARVSGKLTTIEWKNATHPRSVLSRIILEPDSMVSKGLFGIHFPLGTDLRFFCSTEALLDKSILKEANLAYANLQGSELKETNLESANLFEANLSRTWLAEADLSNANLSNANLTCADLEGANLFKAQLNGALLREANFDCANLQNANLWNANLVMAKIREANLADAKLEHANLQYADLRGTYAAGGAFSFADLSFCELEDVDFRDSDLEKANLSGAHFDGANLEGANLESANLKSANLETANLNRALLNKVRMNNATRLPLDSLGTYFIDEAYFNGKKVTGRKLLHILKDLSH